MQSSIQKINNAQLEIKIAVPTDEFQKFMEEAVAHLGSELEIEGFRKGKAPKEMIEKKLGPDMIFQHASQDCVRTCYLQAIKEQNLEPLGRPEIEILKMAPGNPFEFKAKIAVLPEITLGDYQNIVSQIKKKEVKVTAEEIEKMRQEKERIEADKLRQEILDKIAASSKMEIPEVLVNSEKGMMLNNIKTQVPHMLGVSFEEYLKRIKKTEKEILDSFSAEAERRIKNSLVLREIQKREKIEFSEKELAEEMAKISQQSPELDKNQLKEYAESVVKNEKTFKLLESFIKS